MGGKIDLEGMVARRTGKPVNETSFSDCQERGWHLEMDIGVGFLLCVR